MARAFLLKRPSLAYPGGNPGFDPAHPAAKNIRFSGIALNGNFVSLLQGARGTITGSPTSILDGRAGPSVNFPTSSNVAFPSSTTNDLNITFAVIVELTVSQSFSGFMSSSSSAAGWCCSATNGQVKLTTPGVADMTSGIPLNLNEPYFIAISGSSAAALFVVKSLKTGIILTASASGSTPAGAPNGTCRIGAEAFGSSTGGFIAAATYCGTALSMQQMLQWADDPWSFWYPRTFDLTQFLKAPAGGAAVTGTLAATESTDTAAFSGSTVTSGTLAANDAADTASLSGNVIASGTLAATESVDVAAFTGGGIVSGTLSATEAADAVTFSGNISAAGTLATTEATDSASLSGSVISSGTLAAIEAADTAAFSGGAATGTLAATEAADVMAVAGDIGISGSFAITEAVDVAAFLYSNIGIWTPVMTQAETWTANTPGLHVFSPDVFSHAISSGKRVFALGSSPAGTEFWDRATVQSETWTVIP